MQSERALSKRSIVGAVASALLAVALAGCVGGGETVDPNSVEAICGAGAGPGPGISPESLVLQSPFTLCVHNRDAEDHPMMGMVGSAMTPPEWVPEPTEVDPHAAHKAAASGPPPVLAEKTIPAGETLVYRDIKFNGIINFLSSVFEYTHMSVKWEVLPEAPADYPVLRHSVITGTNTTGDVDAGGTGVHDFEVTYPDMTLFRATVEWDDGEDDGELGQTANQADTLSVTLKDADGEVIAGPKEMEKRGGKIEVEYRAEITYPDSFTADGLSNATAALAAEVVPDTSTVGTWTVEVQVLSAPGLAPDEDGSTKGLPTGDGHQAYTIDVQYINTYATATAPSGVDGPQQTRVTV